MSAAVINTKGQSLIILLGKVYCKEGHIQRFLGRGFMWCLGLTQGMYHSDLSHSALAGEFQVNNQKDQVSP